MIRLKLTYINDTTYETVVPTVFPDNTSQVFKIKSIANDYANVTHAEIIWQYENESEFLHVAQLKDLLDSFTGYPRPVTVLNIPFLPYGRQDKPISNTTTFAQRTFTKLVDSLNFDRVISFDVHGVCSIKNLHKLSANTIIKKVFDDNKYDIYCYPDGGACERYIDERSEEPNTINGLKIRNQQTGKIEDYQLETNGIELFGKRILIVDDLCDGGATFIELMKLLKEHDIGEVGLYVSHGIFSKGYEPLIEAGITNFYTTNSLPRNEEKGIKIV